jgi:hypothetical protein
MHCVAGDGVGILAGAVLASLLHVSKVTDITLEYVLGFAFGWSIFQALFMRSMAGGSYRRSLGITFFPELLSMNFLMAGMVPVMTLAMKNVPMGHDPTGPTFWFIMSMSLLVGFITAYPINWWLVSHHLKHGMETVQPGDKLAIARGEQVKSKPPMDSREKPVSTSVLTWMTILTFVIFGLGLSIAVIFGGI